jgi:hypothetical protein
MHSKVNQRALSIAGWGCIGTPLLPRALRERWGNEQLPLWLTKDLHLAEGATYSALGSESLAASRFTSRLKSFLLEVMRSRSRQIATIRVLPSPLPIGLDVTSLPLAVRTRNCLVRHDLLSDRSKLERATYADLLGLSAVGISTVLDLASVVEAATDKLQRTVHAGEAGSASEVEEISADLVDAIGAPWSQEISGADPRFQDLFPPGEGTIWDRIDLLTSQPQEDPGGERALSEALGDIRTRINTIRTHPLDRQLREFIQAMMPRLDHAKVDALVMRYGFGGQPPVTLEESAAKLGITRERIRQLQKEITDHLPQHPIFMPALDAAIQDILSRIPMEVETASTLLQERHLSTVPFHPASVLSAAKFCMRPIPFQIESYGDHERVVLQHTEGVSDLLRIARKQAGASGSSNVKEVLAEAASRSIRLLSERELTDLLGAQSGIEFLEGDWFWCTSTPSVRNRVRNVSRKMLSVASTIHISSIREGIRRHFRYRGSRGTSEWPLVIPPRAVLARFYQVHPEFVINGEGMVTTVEHLDCRKELGQTEQVFVDVLRSSPTCVLERESLAKGCLARGCNQHTISTFLSYSPVVEHLGTDLWSLRGVKVDPTAVEAVRAANAARPKEKRVLDHGWTVSGSLWLAVRIPALHNSLVIGVPSVIRHMLASRRFTATETRTPHGPRGRRAGPDGLAGDPGLLDHPQWVVGLWPAVVVAYRA